MSNPLTKQEHSQAKDARQMPAPDQQPKHRRKKRKPWRIEERWVDGVICELFGSIWRTKARYETEAQAQQALETLRRKERWSVEYRIVNG